MNIVITMAGHSRRFNEAGYAGPKGLLTVGNKPMIEHVINMFDLDSCKYFIVVNNQQVEHTPGLEDYLSNLAPRVQIIVVDSHELGPVYSSLQIEGIEDDDEVIVTYCDFIVEWNYPLFLRHIRGSDGAVVSFRGFHPASFGDTYYAYLRVDEQNHMLELREKISFTDKREDEHASAGIYYYKNWGMFRSYGEAYLEKGTNELPEVYASLLYNDMVDDGLEVTVHEANKFICLGTPSDLEQYQFWWSYFVNDRKSTNIENDKSIKKIGLIPMAGEGSRFKKYGYRVAKPLITVQDMPMVVLAAKSLPYQSNWIFLARQDDIDRHPIKKTLRDIYPECVVQGINKTTLGQAATCLLAQENIDDNAELTIASCDYETIYDPSAWKKILDDQTIDGAIWTVRLKSLPVKNANSFAYCRLGDDGNTIIEVVEKKTISNTPSLDPLVVGTFWYRRGSDFKRGAKNLIENNITVNGEFYIGTSINNLITKGLRFVIFDVEQWISFGDPFELKIMEYWHDYFERN